MLWISIRYKLLHVPYLMKSSHTFLNYHLPWHAYTIASECLSDDGLARQYVLNYSTVYTSDSYNHIFPLIYKNKLQFSIRTFNTLN